MEISSFSNVVTITGNIKSVGDYQDVKIFLDILKKSHSTIDIELKDSISITSSIIGYFNKLVLKDKIQLQLKIGNSQLMELLDDLNLSSTFNAKKA